MFNPKLVKIVILFTLILLSPMSVYAVESVILLHGLARTEKSFKKLETVLKDKGYHVVNQGYPSTEMKIEELSELAVKAALENCKESSKVHFVTHSMGGILVRQYLQNNSINNLGRVVMLGPPNQGSEVVDKFQSLSLFKLINGPAGLQLGTSSSSVPNTIGPANFEVGVIAGKRSVNLFLSTLLPGKDDGKVTVCSTKLEGMKDHITLAVTHPFMMSNKKAIEQVLYFLSNGSFNSKTN